jgi:hypothetical protein
VSECYIVNLLLYYTIYRSIWLQEKGEGGEPSPPKKGDYY